MKMPSMHFYPADWRKDLAVQSLDYFDRGVWFELLCLMHESDERGVLLLNGRPMPRPVIARLLGLTLEVLDVTLNRIVENGVARQRADGAIYSKRMVADEAFCDKRRTAGRIGATVSNARQSSSTTPGKRSASASANNQQGGRQTISKCLSKRSASASAKPTPFIFIFIFIFGSE